MLELRFMEEVKLVTVYNKTDEDLLILFMIDLETYIIFGLEEIFIAIAQPGLVEK